MKKKILVIIIPAILVITGLVLVLKLTIFKYDCRAFSDWKKTDSYLRIKVVDFEEGEFTSTLWNLCHEDILLVTIEVIEIYDDTLNITSSIHDQLLQVKKSNNGAVKIAVIINRKAFLEEYDEYIIRCDTSATINEHQIDGTTLPRFCLIPEITTDIIAIKDGKIEKSSIEIFNYGSSRKTTLFDFNVYIKDEKKHLMIGSDVDNITEWFKLLPTINQEVCFLV